MFVPICMLHIYITFVLAVNSFKMSISLKPTILLIVLVYVANTVNLGVNCQGCHSDVDCSYGNQCKQRYCQSVSYGNVWSSRYDTGYENSPNTGWNRPPLSTSTTSTSRPTSKPNSSTTEKPDTPLPPLPLPHKRPM